MNRNETLHYFIRDEGVAGSNPATPTILPAVIPFCLIMIAGSA